MSFETPNKSLCEKPKPLKPEEKEMICKGAEQLENEEKKRSGQETDDFPVGKDLGEHRKEILKSNHPEYYDDKDVK